VKIKAQNFLQLSFRTTFYFLMLACTFTLIAVFFVKTNFIRYILLTELTITGIAAFVYNYYNNSIIKYNLTSESTLGWNDINRLRYFDWFNTTPLMLISFILILSLFNNIPINISLIIIIIILDFIMLSFGYIGEQNILNKILANILGFIPFLILFYIIYITFIKDSKDIKSIVLFITYFVLWSMYGVLYMFDEKIMNQTFNILDCISKAFVSIGITIYFLLYYHQHL